MELNEALQIILEQSSEKGDMAYAQTYAIVAKEMVGEELRVQLLYVLSNLQYWRGEQAREIKKCLKEYSTPK